MKKYRAKDVSPGMKLGQDITSSTGAILMPEGSILTEKVIDAFENWQVQEVYVLEEEKQVISQRQELERQFKSKYVRSVNEVMRMMDRLEETKEIEQDTMRTISEDLSDLTKDYSYIKLFSELADKDRKTYQHSINVGIYSAMLGRWLGYVNAVVKELLLTGLLHDIGKTQLPEAILHKIDNDEALTEEELEQVREHPVRGYDLINQHTNFHYNVARGVLEHHEKVSGEGYPAGKEEYQIHIYAKIVSLTNTFDNIVFKKKSHNNSYSFQDLEKLNVNASREFDMSISRTFMHHMKNLFLGSQVLLSDGRKGEIVMMNRDEITKPLVKVGSHYIDLYKNRGIYIEEVVKL